MYSIYKITSPSGKVYIGQSKQVKKRLYDYKWCDPKQAFLHNSLLKYGYKNHIQEIIIEGLTFNEANIEEIKLIKIYKDLEISLNISDGGQLSSYTRKRSVIKFNIDGILLQEYPSVKEAAESENLISSDIVHPLKNKNYYSNGFLWIYKDDYLKGIIPIWKAKFEGKSTKSKKIYQFDLNGILLNTYNSCEEAGKAINKPGTSIASNVRGVTYRVSNFIFSSVNKVNKYKDPRIGNKYPNRNKPIKK